MRIRSVNRIKTGAAVITLITGHTSDWTDSYTITSDVNDLTIDWGDGSPIESITQNVAKTHAYTAGTYNVNIYTASTKITKYVNSTTSRLKTINFNILLEIVDSLFFQENSTLNSIEFGDFNNTASGTFNLKNTSLTTLDLSNLKINLLNYYVISNTSLQNIIFKNDTNTITSRLHCYSNTALLNLDLSYVKITTSSQFYCYSNTSLQTITFKNDTNTITSILYMYSNPALTSLDFSFVTLNCSTFDIYSCTNLANVIFKSGSQAIGSSNQRAYSCVLINGLNTASTNYVNNNQIQLQNNGMTAASVNKELYLADLDGATGGNIDLSGTNAAPDTTSGGYNGVAAKASLQAKGWTVTTN